MNNQKWNPAKEDRLKHLFSTQLKTEEYPF